MQEKPKVSYVCSVKNGSSELERCAMSVLGQSAENLELIIVDDHSVDSTWEIIQSLSARDKRVRGVKNQGMDGLTYSLNMGLDFARGEYVARIDVDDFAHRDRTKKQIEEMDSSPTASMCTSMFRVVDTDDWELYCHGPSCDPKKLKWSLCFRNNIRHSTVMWRRSMDMRYEPSFKYAQDYELWCRMARVGEVKVIPEILATIKSRPSSITSTNHEHQEAMADRVSAEQYEFYTGVTINERESRNLRMVYYLKSSEQFDVFNNINSHDFSSAVERYCRLAEAFATKESPDQESFLSEIGNDINSLMGNPSRAEDTAKSVRKISKLLGCSSVVHQIEKRFVNI